MCIVFFHSFAEPTLPYKLILAANRDEFYERPTLPSHIWDVKPRIIAGQDKVKGGTWLGINEDGLWAALTNNRTIPLRSNGHHMSRGELVADILKKSAINMKEHIEHVANDQQYYRNFNLLCGSAFENIIYYYGSEDIAHPTGEKLESGRTYVLSNALLASHWPKMEHGRQIFDRILTDNHGRDDESLVDQLWRLLLDQTKFPVEDCPTNTAIGPDKEHLASSIFISPLEMQTTIHPSGDLYGTVSSAIILVDQQNRIVCHERSWAEFFRKHSSASRLCSSELHQHPNIGDYHRTHAFQ